MKKQRNILTKIVSAVMALTLITSLCCVGASALSDTTYTKGATVTVGSTTTYYDSLQKAWNNATQSTNRYDEVTVRLYEDWIGTNGSLGEGNGFSVQGGLEIFCFKNGFNLDLNGHSIDRKAPAVDGMDSTIRIGTDSVTYIYDSTNSSKSEIRGGYAFDQGGAICAESIVHLDNITFTKNHSNKKGGAIYVLSYSQDLTKHRGELYINNCVFKENSADESGGAIFIDDEGKVTMYDTVITNNTAKKDGGGINSEVHTFDTATLKIGGKIIIKDNTVLGMKNNLCLDENFFVKATVSFDEARPLTSDSHIGLYSKTSDKTLRITENSPRSHYGKFHYDTSAYTIEAKGSGDSQYLQIRKA